MENSRMTKAMLGRLPRYLTLLKDITPDEMMYISATKIAKELSLGEVQVRKDLNVVCGKGKPKRGYKITELIRSIEAGLGRSSATSAVLVGAGRLGRALLEYDEFEKYGVKIVAAFDCNEYAVQSYRSMEVLPMAKIGEFCWENNVKIGIITVGEGSAQTVCDKMVECGIKAIWNFAPCKLTVPDGIILLQENLALSLAYLNNKLLKQN